MNNNKINHFMNIITFSFFCVLSSIVWASDSGVAALMQVAQNGDSAGLNQLIANNVVDINHMDNGIDVLTMAIVHSNVDVFQEAVKLGAKVKPEHEEILINQAQLLELSREEISPTVFVRDINGYICQYGSPRVVNRAPISQEHRLELERNNQRKEVFIHQSLISLSFIKSIIDRYNGSKSSPVIAQSEYIQSPCLSTSLVEDTRDKVYQDSLHNSFSEMLPGERVKLVRDLSDDCEMQDIAADAHKVCQDLSGLDYLNAITDKVGSFFR